MNNRYLHRPSCVNSRRNPAFRDARGWLLATVLLAWPLATSVEAAEPARAVTIAPVPGFSAPVVASRINVLILALDEVQVVSSVAVPPVAASSAAPEIAPAPPLNAVPEDQIPAIVPASLFRNPIEVRGFAQKKPKVDKDADLFRPLPEPPSGPSYIARDKNGNIIEPKNADASPLPLPAEALPTDSLPRPGESPLLLPAEETAIPKPPGVAQAAAAPLRRALQRMGFQDVLTTAPDGSAVLRVVQSRRLSARVLDTLQTSSSQLISATLATPAGQGNGQAPQSPALAPAVKAAARVGQTLGYRAVVVLSVVPNAAQSTLSPAHNAPRASTYSMLLVDSLRETGNLLMFDESGNNALDQHEAAAASGAALLSKDLQTWPEIPVAEKKQMADKHLADARTAIAAKDLVAAEDLLNQVTALDPNRAEAYLLMGDALQGSNRESSISSYRQAAGLRTNDGETWAKIAVAYTTGDKPNWPGALEAGNKAIALGFDSSTLRQAMATAQLGRAELFRRAERLERAEDAEAEARQHLDRALELDPDDPGVTRLMTQQLVVQGRYREAVKALDRIALQYPDDVEIQTQYATSLMEVSGRDEDAFVAWARVWKLSGQGAVPVDAVRYRKLSNGFDLRLANLGKRAAQLSAGVAGNTVPRASALLQMTRYIEDMDAAVTAIKVLRPAGERQVGGIHASRIFAADSLSQALENYQLYLETGQELYRNRANELHRQSIITLNGARTMR